jgi:hypothetical protein
MPVQGVLQCRGGYNSPDQSGQVTPLAERVD